MGFIDRVRAYAERSGGSGGAGRDGTERSPQERALIKVLQEQLSRDAAAPARYYLRFSGNVQGVGFRWTNQGTANELKLAGWMRNLPDGTVELELQGAPGAIIKHLDTIHAYYGRMRCRMWLDTYASEPCAPDDAGFSVRY